MSDQIPTLASATIVVPTKVIPTISPFVSTVAAADTVVEAVDPGITGKALVASKTPWGVLAAYGVTFLGAHYGLGLDPGTTGVVAGAAVLAGSYAMRYITSVPITGLLSRL